MKHRIAASLPLLVLLVLCAGPPGGAPGVAAAPSAR